MDGNTAGSINELAARMRASGKRKFVLQLPEGLKAKAVMGAKFGAWSTRRAMIPMADKARINNMFIIIQG